MSEKRSRMVVVRFGNPQRAGPDGETPGKRKPELRASKVFSHVIILTFQVYTLERRTRALVPASGVRGPERPHPWKGPVRVEGGP